MILRVIRYLGLAIAVIALYFVFRPLPSTADDRLHITYWEKWTGFEGEAARAVVDAFNARQDRIFVDLLTVSRVDQKMLLATAGGNPPDVAGLWDANVDVFAGYEALLPLDDLCDRDGIGEDDYLPAYWRMCFARGQIYALPTTPASVALHWNRQHFRDAGLDPDRAPETLEELDAMAKQLSVRANDGRWDRMGFMPSEPGWWNWGWGYFFGGKLWDGHDRLTAATPENIRAYEWVRSYANAYGEQDLQLFQSGFGNFSSPQNAFLDGKVSMEIQGVWMNNFIAKYSPELDWAAAPFPPPADRPDLAGTNPVGMDVLVIPAGAKNVEAAWEFIKYVQSQEGMELLCMKQQKHSPLTYVSDRFYREHPNPFIQLFYDLAKSERAFIQPKTAIWQPYKDELNNAFQRVWTQGVDPAIALGDVDRRIQPQLDQQISRRERRELAQGR